MFSLYKKNGNKILYWNALEVSRRKGYVYTSIVGELEGEPEEVTTGFFSSFAKEMGLKAEALKAQGYVEALDDITLVIVFHDELSAEQQVALDTGLDEYISNRNLGFTDGSFSPDSIHCLVVDYQLALKHIKAYLATTPFHNYKEIYNLDELTDDDEEDQDDEDNTL
jgi:hypothetical protein